MIVQKKKKKKIKLPQIRNPAQHMVQAQLSKLWVAESSRCGSKWNGHACQWEDLAVGDVCSPSHHQTGAQLCPYSTLEEALAITGQLTSGKGY